LTDDAIVLTREQHDFIARRIPGFGVPKWKLSLAGHAGSNRTFIRIEFNKATKILVVWDGSDPDWNNFITIQMDIEGRAPIVPQIFDFDAATGLILEEDVGTITLKKLCTEQPESVLSAYKKALDTLILWQTLLAHDCEPITSRSMDYATFEWESSYFAEHCVKGLFGLSNVLTDAWEQERTALARAAASLPQVAIHRDFQSENICILDNRAIRFVDYQGARMGPAGYDVASLLYDPYVILLTDSQRNDLLAYYRQASGSALTERDYAVCALQRLMQALGAYGNLSLNKGKPQYRAFVPIALERCFSMAQKLPEAAYCAHVIGACIQQQKTMNTSI